MARALFAVVVFLGSFFMYSIVWYIFGPVLDTILVQLASSVTLTGEALTTFNNLNTLFRYSWTWIGVLAVITTIVWMYIFSYREEVESGERGYF